MPMHRPHKAFVLAAGFGTRMRPLSRDLPKPLMPLWGRPVLEHLLRLLRDWGVRDVLLNTHYQPGELVRFATRCPVPPLRLNLSFEPEILGTGGALRRAAWFLDEQPFWLVNADIAADLDPSPLLRAFARPNTLAALWLHPTLGPRTVVMKNGRVTGFRAPHPGAAGTYTFCGLHLVSPRILDYLPREGFAGIVPAYERALKRGKRIAGVCVPEGFWADLGTPRQYLEAHAHILERARQGQSGRRLFDPALLARVREAKRAGARIEGFAALGNDVHLAAGAHLKDSVVWDGARLGPRARVTGAVVGRGARVNETVPVLAGRGDLLLDAEEQKLLTEYRWRPDRATALPFGPRGSARTFTRIRRGRDSVILLRYDPARAENALYTAHARFLAGLGVRVPAVLADRPDRCLALLEDVGDRTLREAVGSAPARELRRLYRAVLNQVARWHDIGTRRARQQRLTLMPPFSKALYRWERQLFATHFLGPLARCAPAESRRILRELAGVAARLNRAPAVLLHRDLQSSNILLKKGRPVFIDFQGMRFGPAAYDLASLLCDPYVELPPALQDELLEYYTARRPKDLSATSLFWPAAVERLVQALGAFGRLSVQPGLGSFAEFIPPALRMLRRALARIEPRPGLMALTGRLSRPS